MASGDADQTTRDAPTYDIVQRLRDPSIRIAGDVATMSAAAAEIERLRAELLTIASVAEGWAQRRAREALAHGR